MTEMQIIWKYKSIEYRNFEKAYRDLKAGIKHGEKYYTTRSRSHS